MTWTCDRCGARFPDSGGERGNGCLSCTAIVPVETLEEIASELHREVDSVGVDPDEGATMVSRKKLRSWRDRLRMLSEGE